MNKGKVIKFELEINIKIIYIEITYIKKRNISRQLDIQSGKYFCSRQAPDLNLHH